MKSAYTHMKHELRIHAVCCRDDRLRYDMPSEDSSGTVRKVKDRRTVKRRIKALYFQGPGDVWQFIRVARVGHGGVVSKKVGRSAKVERELDRHSEVAA